MLNYHGIWYIKIVNIVIKILTISYDKLYFAIINKIPIINVFKYTYG